MSIDHQTTSTVIRSARDVHALLAEKGSQGTKTKAIIVLALGGIFMDAYDFSSLAFGITAVKEEFGLDPLMTGVVNAAIMVGSVVGAIFGGMLVDRFGRYKLFMADMAFFVVAAIGCALAPNEWVLIFFRFVMGVGVGLDLPVAMAFLAEFSKLRGSGSRSQRVNAWSPAWYIATGFGYLLVLAVFLLLPVAQHGILWRVVVGFGAVPAIVVLLVRRKYMAESPQWLADQGDLRGAVDVMRSHHGLDVELAPDAESARTTVKARTGHWRQYGELFAPRYRLRTIAALCVSVFSTFGYNAVAYGTPLIIAMLFQQGPLVTILSALVINLGFGAAGGLLGVGLINRVGARRMTIIGFAIQAASLLVLAIVGIPTGALVTISIAMLAAFVFAQAGGPGANLMSYATLSYPTRLRGVGVGFNEAIKRVFSIVSLVFFPVLAASLSTGVFWIVALAPLAGLVSLLLISWDPTGKDVDAEDQLG
ncbi:MFS transporter [Microbacterium esteraromaticum]|uniref:MFS transporter n=1 Tax=Microbacterium esteraromaticum TaxID=57043 RepID=A0A7D7WDL0_9MICO|nr:MFS transporter [Microbacterium esteraromaticum]QMU97059.1 MFS transporter [Microbacterium esteraromaticum]